MAPDGFRFGYFGIDNVIFGTWRNDSLVGSDGVDLILARPGNDRIFGGLGSDLIDGGRGFDTAEYTGDARDFDYQHFGHLWFVTDQANGDKDTLYRVEALKFDNATFKLDGTNNAPIADDVVVSLDEGSAPLVLNLLEDSDAFDFENDSLTIVSAEQNERLSVDLATGEATYDASAGVPGLGEGETLVEQFAFVISDGVNEITRTLEVTVVGVGEPLVAVDDAFTTGENGFFIDNFLANDSGVSAIVAVDTLVFPPNTFPFDSHTLGAGTTLGGEANGDFSYSASRVFFPVGTPEPFDFLTEGETATDSFSYTVVNEDGDSATATVTITLVGENDAPLSREGSVSLVIPEDVGPTQQGAIIDDFDSDDDASTLTYEVLGAAPGVTVTSLGGGLFDYSLDESFQSLAPGQTRSGSFDYSATDSHGATTNTTKHISVFGLNDAPVAADDVFQPESGTILTGDLFADNGNGIDFDIDDGDSFLVSAVNGLDTAVGNEITLASGALLTVEEGGGFTYDPNGFSGDDTFSYTIADSALVEDTATVTILQVMV